MITDQANQQAEKNINEAKLKGEDIIQDAQQKAAAIIRQAEERAKYVKEEVLGEVKGLERDFKAMDHYKSNLMVQMRSLANATIDHVDRFEAKFDKEGVEDKFKEATTMLESEEVPIEIEVVKPVSKAEDPEEQALEALALAQESGETVENIAEETPETIENALAEVNENIEGTTEPISEVVENTIVAEPVVETVESVEEAAEPTIEPIAETTTEAVESAPEQVEEAAEQIAAPVESIVASSVVNETPKTDELEIIEGIGPKIADLLRENGILTFADLAKTPTFRIKEILVESGPQFARHDPTTWTEQALLAATGRMDELEVLKEKLHAGRHIEDEVQPTADPVVEVHEPVIEAVAEPTPEPVVEPVIVATPEPIVEPVTVATPEPIVEAVVEATPEPIVEAVVEATPEPIVEAVAPAAGEAITEDMLEKVNKVKAAIRKAMAEKAENQQKDNTPLTTVNDVIAKNEGGSFFDNI
jgi:predicted flap endonuclease-1-like 5' DNA nuclease/cell division septum initiation protein DivIVA